MSESGTQLEVYYFIMFYYILLFYYIKVSGIFYPSIAARKCHRQDGCSLSIDVTNEKINCNRKQCSIYSTSPGGRSSMILDGIRQGRTGVKKT